MTNKEERYSGISLHFYLVSRGPTTKRLGYLRFTYWQGDEYLNGVEFNLYWVGISACVTKNRKYHSEKEEDRVWTTKKR